MTTLQERLDRKDIVILDGGIGTELQRRGVPMDASAWCATALKTHPGAVRELHEDYLRAGADVITANTFSAARHVLEAVGLGDEVAALNRRAVELAREARDSAADRTVWVAGSMSSFVAGLDPARRPPVERAKASYREQAELLAEAGVDLILMEMMMDLEQASCAVEAALSTGLPVWIGFSCRVAGDGAGVLMYTEPEGGLRFEEVLRRILPLGGAVAGVMHSSIRDTAPALAVLFEHWSGPVAAYAESGDFVMPNWDFVDVMSPQDYAAVARTWVESGVQVVGGCCGTGPEHIGLLKRRLPRRLPAADGRGGAASRLRAPPEPG